MSLPGDFRDSLPLWGLLMLCIAGIVLCLYILAKTLEPEHIQGSIVFIPRLGLNARVIGNHADMYVVRIEEHTGPVTQWRDVHVMPSEIQKGTK